MRESTLTGEMVAWLLEGQTALVEVEMGLPGCEGRAWDALEKVGGSFEVLKVWDRWGGPGGGTARSKRGKAKAVVPAPAPAQDDVDELASDTEADTVDEAPALPPSHISGELLGFLPHLDALDELIIDDSPASGLRKAVEAVFAAPPAAADDDAAHLPELTRLVSVVKKLKSDVQKHKSKALEKLCEKRGIEWVVREGA